MADCALLSHHQALGLGDMQHTIVLDVCLFPDSDAIHIGSEGGMEPDGCSILQMHIPDEVRCRCDIALLSYGWLYFVVSGYHASTPVFRLNHIRGILYREKYLRMTCKYESISL